MPAITKKMISQFMSGLMLATVLSLFQPLSVMAGAAEGDLEGAKLSELLDQSGI